MRAFSSLRRIIFIYFSTLNLIFFFRNPNPYFCTSIFKTKKYNRW